MLEKRLRLKNPKAFNATYKNSDTVGNRYAVVYRGKKKNDETQETKVGFVVSKKYHKRAVKRNRAKRLFSEAYRILLAQKEIEPSQQYMSLIFIIKQACLDMDFETCKNITKKLLSE